MNIEDLSIENTMAKLPTPDGKPFVSLFAHGSLEIEMYAPKDHDLQQSHDKDEVYVIACGHGWFVNGNSRYSFQAGQVLFVPAGAVHRFEDFSEDFSTWVIFYGPKGGEAQ